MDGSADLHLDVDLVGYPDPSDAPHRPLPGVHLDEAFVPPHLEAVPGVATLLAGRPARWHHELLRRQGDGGPLA